MIEKTAVFADGLDHPECVAWHPDGSLWAGGEAGQIYRISRDGRKVEQVASTGGFILGIAFSPDLSWLAVCDLAAKCIWRMDMNGFKLVKFAATAGDHQINIPNYPCFDSMGNLYVSESGAFRQVNGKILRYDPAGKGRVWHEGPYNFANGMAIDPGEKHIYVACSFLPGIERVQIRESGTAGEREVFATVPHTVPDGLAFDAGGNLYVSCYAPNRIYRITPDREVTTLVDDWEAHTISNPTNMAFGGDSFDQLFIANLGRWHIARIDLGTKGLKLACHK